MPATMLEITRQALVTALWLTMPVLLVAALLSLLVSIAQVVTSIQDATIAAVPKLAAVGVAVFLLLPWFLRKLVTFTAFLFQDFHRFLG